ncbi:RNA polymerase sigma-I factor [Paenibacillus alginolyticus]|uniref:RNA polymerase sigma factor SigI n=1 Tax=Paenibacillus alginolyticus TaxID=59839 RepID=A0ABT4GGQ1_9BACL|nr:RNA polymerase sigma-I factor [Paenibacillus alginolyticus]MCY9695244.1 RNA polymerase sigma-I factor [Paenibacillus alginolyticus]MEC0144865.1 RNA polymerase sigma-I factor [Paenibacillus alginolyticus]
MEEFILSGLIKEAQEGNEQSRQEIIQGNKLFLERVTSKICKRMITWNDDEMSISLIAFNEAIDRYQQSQNDNFFNYAKLVIQSRLTDYFRKESRQQSGVSLDARPIDTKGEYESNPFEIKQSWDHYNEQKMIQERLEEIQLYSARLEEFGIFFEELEEASPDRADARNNLIEVAYGFVKHPHLVDVLLGTKQLPLKQILDFIHVSRKTIERGRKYLISLIIILISDDLPHLKSSIAFPDLKRRGIK